MSSITAEDLQNKFQQFQRSTENAIQGQLLDFASTLQEALRDDLRSVIVSSLHAYHLSLANQAQTLQPGSDMDTWRLPNQLLEPEAPRVDANRSPALEKQNVSVQPSSSKADSDQETANDALPVSNRVHYSGPAFNDEQVECGFSEAKKDMTRMRTAIPHTQGVADELTDLGYFHARVAVDSEAHKMVAAHSAQNMMLKGGGEDTWTQRGQTSDYLGLNTTVIASVVQSDAFEYLILGVILFNAIFIGIETDLAAKDNDARESVVLKVLEVSFCIIFTFELSLRIFVFKGWFFKSKTPQGRKNPQLVWNVFDTVLVASQVLNYIVQGIFENTDDSVLGKTTVLRLLRILRLGRLFRVGKLLQIFRTLRTIVHSISASWSLFIWALFSLQLINYLFAVYITELLVDELHNEEVDPDLKYYFGTVPDSMLSMMKSGTGGIDWGDVYTPLFNFSRWAAAYPFFLCLMFEVIVVMNVFTGMFMDSVAKRARQQNEMELVSGAYEIFKHSDLDGSGQITKADFQKHLRHADVNQFFNAIDLDIQQAEVLFDLLDMNGNGFISCSEFLRGCARLHGASKALDLLVLSREVTHLFDGIAKLNKEGAEAAYLQRQFLVDMAAENQKLLRSVVKSPDKGSQVERIATEK